MVKTLRMEQDLQKPQNFPSSKLTCYSFTLFQWLTTVRCINHTYTINHACVYIIVCMTTQCFFTKVKCMYIPSTVAILIKTWLTY